MMSRILKDSAVFNSMFSRIKSWIIPSVDNDYRPRFLQSRVVAYSVLILLVLNIISAAFYFPFPQNIFFADVTKSELIRLLNEQRQSLGLGILTENQKLDQAARLKAQDMINNGYFSHQSPRGITPWFWFKQVGYSYQYAGENLAVGFVDSAVVYDAWVDSPSHKANLLNPKYREVGTAVIQGFGGNDSIVVVQLFGSPIVKNPKLETLNSKQVPTSKPQNPKPVPVQEPIPAPQPAPSPTQTAVTPAPTVLGTEFPTISAPKDAAPNSIYYQFLNFIVYDNIKVLHYISYALLLALLICLMIAIFVNVEIQRKDLLFRSLLLIFGMIVSVSINHETLSQLLPHYITI